MSKFITAAATASFAIAGLISASVLATAPAVAGGKSYAKAAVDKALADDNISFQHQSTLRIDTPNGSHTQRKIRVGLGKSILVELGSEMRDVMVSNPQAVDAVVMSQTRVFLMARKLGETNAFFFDSQGNQFVTLEIFVERDTSGLQALLARLIPGSNIKVEMVNQTIILTGSVKTPLDSNRAGQIAKQFVQVEYESTQKSGTEGTSIKKVAKDDGETLVNLLTIEGEDQVMLKVTIAEIQRETLKQFGINMGAIVNSGNFATRILTDNALPLTAAAGLGGLPVAGVVGGATPALNIYNQGPGGGSVGNAGVHGFYNSHTAQVAHALRAMERAGLARTLAEPNLTAVSGETAKFLAGGEFPIPVADGTGGISIIFKEFGVGLQFTPVVLSEGRISLKIETEVSELSNNGAITLSNVGINALKKRLAKSTVELPSGGSLALAGMISEDTRQNMDGTPWVKDLPILGTLFRSRDFQKRESELVVIVTPYVVRPVPRQNLVRPDDGFAPASDLKANFLGHINRVYGKGRAQPAHGGLKGDHGFIVE
jgi:pilus assembly protein CpaC